MSRHPTLRDELRQLMISYILKRESLCKERMIEMIDEEMSYINKMHEDFKLYDDKNDEEAESADEYEDRFVHRGYMLLSSGRLGRTGLEEI